MNDCACLYGYDGDSATFFVQRWVTARKEHRCCECHRVIPKGAQYERIVGKWETLDTYKTCIACQDIRQSLYCDGWVYLMLWEDVTEQIFKETGLTIGCIDKLATSEGKAYLQQRWMEYLEV